LLDQKYVRSAGNLGGDGDVAPDIPLELIMEAINSTGQKDRKIAMDIASSEFYKADAKKYGLVLESLLRQWGLRFINIAGVALVVARVPFAGYAFYNSSPQWCCHVPVAACPESHRRWELHAVA